METKKISKGKAVDVGKQRGHVEMQRRERCNVPARHGQTNIPAQSGLNPSFSRAT